MENLDFANNPVGYMAAALLLGFGGVALAKLYGLFFMRGKTPHRLGDQMANTRAEVTEWSGDEGYVRADGELWRATSTDTLSPGDDVIVTHADGLKLKIKKI